MLVSWTDISVRWPTKHVEAHGIQSREMKETTMLSASCYDSQFEAATPTAWRDDSSIELLSRAWWTCAPMQSIQLGECLARTNTPPMHEQYVGNIVMKIAWSHSNDLKACRRSFSSFCHAQSESSLPRHLRIYDPVEGNQDLTPCPENARHYSPIIHNIDECS